MKANCWNIKKCGRETGGSQAKSLEPCPAATAAIYNGINHGSNGGRYCWRISGTLCNGTPDAHFASKIETCGQCQVFRTIIREEGTNFVL
jgi:hypothetical protein